jgi:hypothetical protein
MFERRSHRTHDPVEALTRLLDAHRDRLGVRTLALSTPEGVIVAGSGESPEDAAALGSRMDRAEADVHESPLGVKEGPIATWRLSAGDVELLLTSVGGRLSYDVGSGVRRIVAELAG